LEINLMKIWAVTKDTTAPTAQRIGDMTSKRIRWTCNL